MKIDIIKFSLEEEQDVLLVGKTAAQLCGLTGLDGAGQQRFAEAVNEVSKNYLKDNKKGSVRFEISESDSKVFLKAIISSAGKSSLKPVLSGNYPLFNDKAKDGTQLRGLAEHFSISSAESYGKEIVLGQEIPHNNKIISKAVIRKWKKRLTGLQETVKSEVKNPEGIPRKLRLSAKEREAQERLHEIEVLNLALSNANDRLKQSSEEQEARVRERTLELSRSNEELHRSNKDLEQFAYTVSHDLQEPLRKIHSYGERLMYKFDGQLGQEGEDYIYRMQDAANRMQVLIEDMLAFSRVSRSHDPFIKTSLSQLVNDLISDMEISIAQKKANIRIGSLPEIEVIPWQIRQLFQNLISNGLKFTSEQRAPEIFISSEARKNGKCTIYVKDNGIGFSEEYSEQIFEIFTRLNTRGKYQGSGIGLAICKKILDNHNGSITAKSAQGEGATFIIKLPLNRMSAHPEEEL